MISISPAYLGQVSGSTSDSSLLDSNFTREGLRFDLVIFYSGATTIVETDLAADLSWTPQNTFSPSFLQTISCHQIPYVNVKVTDEGLTSIKKTDLPKV